MMPGDFRPLPFLRNPHLQTILGNLLAGPALDVPARLIEVPLPDGDRIVLHETLPLRWKAGRPAALLVHGLGGSHRSGYLLRLTRRLLAQDIGVYRLDLRAAGAGIGLARRLYSAACAPDVRAAAEVVVREAPGSPLWVLGFSLGGNIALNFAADAATMPLPSLRGVIAVAPPIDLVVCSERIDRQRFYNRYYVRHLVRQVERHRRFFPELPRVEFPRGLTLRGFDELYTAPLWGFANALDYYRHASAAPRIPSIRVPTHILTARDDPFIAVESFESLPHSDRVTVEITPRGGHLGFLGEDGQGGVRWGEAWVVGRLLNAEGRERVG